MSDRHSLPFRRGDDSSAIVASVVPMVPEQLINPGLSLAQLWAMLWAHRKASVAIAVGVILLSVIVIKLLPKSYSSTATLMVNYEVNDPLAGKEFPIGLLGSYMSTQIELMGSPEVMLPVIDKLNLVADKTYTAGYSGDPAGLREAVEQAVTRKLVIEQGRYGSQLIYVTYTANSAQAAADVANAVAETYSQQEHLRKAGPASERAERYTHQLDELKDKVQHAQDQMTEFRKRTGLISSDVHIDVDMEALSSLQQRLLDAQNARRSAEAQLGGDPGAGQQVLASTLVQTLKTRLAEQESHMAQLRSTLGANHPQVLELQSEIDSTRRSLQSEQSLYSGNAAAQLRSAKELEEKMQAAVAVQREKVVNLRALQDEASKYQLELDSAENVYKRALDGYDQIMFASNDHYSNVSFVSRAVPPPKATKPKKMTDFIIAVMMAMVLSLAGPLAYELLNRRIRCRDDIERSFDFPVLAQFRPSAAAAVEL